MLNLNSPTVQAMINSLPQGVGNMPVFYGNQPTITTEIQPVPQSTGFVSPYPSPKDMVMRAGVEQQQQQVYTPVQFSAQNQFAGAMNQNPNYGFQQQAYNPQFSAQNQFAGGMNPNPNYGFQQQACNPQFSAQSRYVGGMNPNPNYGFQQMFTGYDNPYMGYGQNMGIMYGTQYMDDDTRQIYEASVLNNVTYEEQLSNTSNLFKSLSRTVSKCLGRSEEDAERCEKQFDIKYPNQEQQNSYLPSKEKRTISVKLMRGDEVVYEPSKTSYVDPHANARNMAYVDHLINISERQERMKQAIFQNIHDTAPEREFYDKDFLYFMNNAGPVLYKSLIAKQVRDQRSANAAALYNRELFKKTLFENNGIKTKTQRDAIDRFTGRNGILPNGMRVSPQHDPSIASSFRYNPNTGSYDITPPNFIRDRLEQARGNFIKSVENNKDQ